MALSPKARIAAVGGALALGVLGAGGAAYAAGGSAGTPAGTPTYVTVVEEEGTGSTAPQRSAEDCPEGTDRGTGGAGSAGTTPGDA